jgi:murein DD-endopeptidase MepM/ murein hydrolase activator NlpD
VQRNKKPNALTILLVPHSQRAPISVRLPVWLVPLLTVLVVAITAVAVVFAFRYYDMQRRLSALLTEQATERVRQREMRATILSQQDEVRGLSAQVEGFQTELLSVRRLSDEIRDILGLPTPTPKAPAAPTQTPEPAPARSQSLGGVDTTDSTVPMGGRTALRPSSRSMRVAVESGNEIVGMRSEVPAEVQGLQELRELVVERMARVDKSERGDWPNLERELRQWTAAPHPWPVHSHPITSEFGYRDLRGTYGFHNGLDIAVWYGTEVHVTKDGTVTYSGWKEGFGWVVEVVHEAGYSTLYAHNSSLIAKVGEKVQAGDVIALSGSSGNSTGPHVHYEIHLNGVPVDPLRYIDGN